MGIIIIQIRPNHEAPLVGVTKISTLRRSDSSYRRCVSKKRWIALNLEKKGCSITDSPTLKAIEKNIGWETLASKFNIFSFPFPLFYLPYPAYFSFH